MCVIVANYSLGAIILYIKIKGTFRETAFGPVSSALITREFKQCFGRNKSHGRYSFRIVSTREIMLFSYDALLYYALVLRVCECYQELNFVWDNSLSKIYDNMNFTRFLLHLSSCVRCEIFLLSLQTLDIFPNSFCLNVSVLLFPSILCR